MRRFEVKRKTAETNIVLAVNLDGTGQGNIHTGSGFLDHMLTLFCKHARLDLTINCQGDMQVDAHHSVEDIGICLGEAIYEALGTKSGIWRYGDVLLPMDEALIMCAVDISGRGMLRYTVDMPREKVGDFDTELVEEFFIALARNAGLTLHIRMLDGTNAHHIIEGSFKAVARALRQAVQIDDKLAGEIPSTKGVL